MGAFESVWREGLLSLLNHKPCENAEAFDRFTDCLQGLLEILPWTLQTRERNEGPSDFIGPLKDEINARISQNLFVGILGHVTKPTCDL